MKSFFKVLGLLMLMSASLMQGYAIVFDKDSPIPYVDIYVYKVDSASAEKALEKHGNFARALGLPQNIIDILEKGRGVSAKVATALGPATDGATVFVQEGFYKVVDAGKLALKFFDINPVIGRIFRGSDHAFHEKVWRGNRGRDAEWATDNPYMYAIVTLPNNLVPLNDPVLLPKRGITGFTITASPDPKNAGNTLYKAVFDPSIGMRQYMSADYDKRMKLRAKVLAATSGERAFFGN